MLAWVQVRKMPVEEPEQSWDRQVFGKSRPGRAARIAIACRRTRSAPSAPAVVAGGASRVTTTVAATSMAAASAVCVNLGRAACREQARRQDDCVAQASYFGEHPCPFHEDGWFRRKLAGVSTIRIPDGFIPLEKFDGFSATCCYKTGNVSLGPRHYPPFRTQVNRRL